MKKIILIALFWVSIQGSSAQGLAVNNTGANPNSSAMLDVSSQNKGILIPRMTTTVRNAIISPENSLLIFQIDHDSGFYYFNSPTSSWIKLGETFTNSCQSVIPNPSYPVSSGANRNFSSNTTASISQVLVPLQTTATEITFTNFTPTNPGKIKISLYSEDGQNKIFEVISDSIFNSGHVTLAISPQSVIKPGYYYITVLPIGGASINLEVYQSGVISTYYLHPNGKNVLTGTLTVLPDMLPASFNPTTITYSDSQGISFRLN